MELRSGRIFDNLPRSQWTKFFDAVEEIYYKLIRECGSSIGEREITKIELTYSDGYSSRARKPLYCHFCQMHMSCVKE